METYRSVDRLIANEVGILVQPVVRLAEGDAGKAPGDEAKIDGREEFDEAVGPARGFSARLGVDNLGRASGNVLELVTPVLNVLVLNGAALGGSRLRHVG